ncbi:MAG TPA: DUF4304 domain-containing protein [Sphingomicrobium sp.]|nr:DUF4304 domain-containing protein [Sphingomicrobium sp.]
MKSWLGQLFGKSNDIEMRSANDSGRRRIVIEDCWRDILAPIIRAEGFKGSGRHFRKSVGDFVLAANLQGSRWGGRFAINLGVRPLALLPEPAIESARKVKEIDCLMRDRLSPDEHDKWWDYADDVASMKSAASDAAEVFQARSNQQFEKMMSFVATATPEIASKAMPMVLAALATLREQQGQIEDARGFARLAVARATKQWRAPDRIKHLL